VPALITRNCLRFNFNALFDDLLREEERQDGKFSASSKTSPDELRTDRVVRA